MTTSRGPDADLPRQSGDEIRKRRKSAANEQFGIALALGGGFSRGFAHLGVLEVLEQEQIPVSFIVGTSIGGLLGAAYADGISVHQLCELGRQVRVRDFIRFHKSTSSPHDRIGQFVREWFHASRVEELSIRTAIVTTDLDTGAPYVFTHGPVDVAIRAGCAFPGLFQPVQHEGRRLADGCIVAPVPTTVAARMNCACVLGVAVNSNSTNSSGNVVHARSAGLNASHENILTPSWIRQADIILEPKVEQINWTDFSRVDEAYAAGVDAMRRAVPHVRDLLARRSQMYLREETSLQSQNEGQSGLAL